MIIQYKETLIKIKDLCYSVDGVPIIKNLNAEVKDIVGRGRVIAILGPSGCGKTTLFRLLSGLIKPTSGTIEILERSNGENYSHPHEGIMGIVAQNYPLFKHLTVLQNLKATGKKIDDCLKILDQFNMSDHKDKLPCQLSGGQRQRIAIMQQMLCSDQYLLMDEPFSGLDVIAKCNVCKLIKHVADLHEDNTVVVITHGIDEAIKVADEIWLLGRDRNESKEVIPGAYIKEIINLAEKDMAWQCCSTPQIYELASYIKNQFESL